jgi:hypothetical protein
VAVSEAQLCSVALLRVGQRQTIADLDEESEEAIACKALYGHCRDAVLEEFAWPFASAEATLALTTVTRTFWNFVYALPVDCLAPRYIDIGRGMAPEVEPPFEVVREASVPSRKVLLTDEEDAVLVYTAKVEEVGVFSPLFSDALVWRLASELALALPIKPGVAGAMDAKYQQAIARAKASQLLQRKGDREPRNEFIRARGGVSVDED